MILTAATLRRTEKRLRSEWLLVIRYICNYALADNAAIIYVIMRRAGLFLLFMHFTLLISLPSEAQALRTLAWPG